jgi:metal-responsive CopG/Arc/MetJ family transcriptional regulator
MRTIQMTLEEKLLDEVDKAVKKIGTTRSAFARQALGEALKQLKMQEKEQRHREGYARKPVRRGEFSDWQGEQVWPEP